MKNKLPLYALGLAAAFTFGGAATAAAQRSPSQTRIPVRKGESAPVETPRVDTVRVTVRDTVRIDVPGPTQTITRVDTVVRMQTLPLAKLAGTFFGIGAGVAVPMNDWRNSTKDGPDFQAQLGHYFGDSPLGLRADVNYAMFGHRDTDCPACPSTKLLSGSGDILLRFPIERTSRLNPILYVLGGGGIDKFTDFLPYRNSEGKIVTAGKDTYLAYPGLQLTAGNGPATTGTVGFTGDKSSFYHWDVGGGLEFNVAGAHMFVETKYKTISTTNGNSHYFPIIAGFNFY